MCETCSKNLIEHQFSIVNGHDYRIIGNLLKLSTIAQNAISPVRIFGKTLKINNKTCIGNFVSFTSDGLDIIVKKILPSLSKEDLIQIKFIGGEITWKEKKHRCKNLYSIPVDDIYKWLNVLGSINSLFLEKEIEVNHLNKIKNNLKTKEKDLENSVLFKKDKIVKELDEHELEDRYREDYIPSKNENEKMNVLIHS